MANNFSSYRIALFSLPTSLLPSILLKHFRMDWDACMNVAEDLHTKGFIFYPRTESNPLGKPRFFIYFTNVYYVSICSITPQVLPHGLGHLHEGSRRALYQRLYFLPPH